MTIYPEGFCRELDHARIQATLAVYFNGEHYVVAPSNSCALELASAYFDIPAERSSFQRIDYTDLLTFLTVDATIVAETEGGWPLQMTARAWARLEGPGYLGSVPAKSLPGAADV